MNLKKKYNEWLFEKYGFDTGEEFEKIPLIYTALPLFSPSLYGMIAMKRFADSFNCGFEQGNKFITEERRMKTKDNVVDDAYIKAVADCVRVYAKNEGNVVTEYYEDENDFCNSGKRKEE